MLNKAVVWSQPNCQYCNMAKSLLRARGYEIEEKIISVTHTKQQFLEEIPDARTVPQILLNGVLVKNGYNGLKGLFGA